MAWPSATYYIISRIYSNWPSLSLSQNAYEGKKKSYWKRQVLMFYRLRKNSKTPQREEATQPHLYVQELKQNAFVSLRPDEEMCLIYAH